MSTATYQDSPNQPGRTALIVCLVLVVVATAVLLSNQWQSPRQPAPASQQPQSISGQQQESTPVDQEMSIEDEIDAAMLAKHQLKSKDFTDGVAAAPAAPAQDAEELRGQYAAAYRKARAEKLMDIMRCEACGRTIRQLAQQGAHLETHHVISVLRIFTEDLDPELVGDVDNLIVLCRNGKRNCHFTIGHDPDGPDRPRPPNWKESNPKVRKDAAKRLLAP